MGRQIFVIRSEMGSYPTVMSDDLGYVDQRICERKHFTATELIC
jgi:hypothetical protein